MFGQTALGSTAINDAASRMFRVEVKGLRQTYRSDKLSYPIRRSGSAFITVPYNRMNEEMQRINRLGGKIISIQPLTPAREAASGAKREATAAHQTVEASSKAESRASDRTKPEVSGKVSSEASGKAKSEANDQAKSER
jgi:hypothetical protein